ncbi:MAG: DUF922 domain-containing protein [bacterium]
MKQLFLTFAISSFLILSASADCEAILYKYIDAEGTIVVTDKFPDIIKKISLDHTSNRLNEYIDEDGVLVIMSRRPDAGKILPKQDVPPRQEIPPDYRQLLVSEDIDYEFYDVYGANFHELLKSMETAGPYDKKIGRRVPGQTQWRLGWSYDSRYQYTYDHDNKHIHVNLDVSDVQIESQIKVMLPKIGDGVRLNEQDLKHWDDFMKTLIEHENDHVRIIKEGTDADRFKQELASLGPFDIPHDGGGDMDHVIQTVVHEQIAGIGSGWFEQIKTANDEYDDVTRHGQNHQARDSFFSR